MQSRRKNKGSELEHTDPVSELSEEEPASLLLPPEDGQLLEPSAVGSPESVAGALLDSHP